MNRLSPAKRAQIVRALVEGNSIRATCRMTDTSKNTVTRLLVELGEVCDAYQDEHLRNLPCKRIQCDEIWSFVYSKAKNVSPEHEGIFGFGDVWTWVAICADTKLVPAWMVGDRSVAAATLFMQDVASRLASRIQLTTDGHSAYLSAVETAFGMDVDYSQLIKLYGRDEPMDTRYSPSECVGTEKRTIMGKPDAAHVSTSYIERQNLTMRMGMRRFTRLTNAFSKKAENLAAALAIHYMHYNFCRTHKTLKTTPAVASGVADHEWSIDEIVALLVEREKSAASK
ncbi:MAG TPA: IS1 family transposase [Anaerolineales bacterium]|nr:IS1 family transposase [Anaerolineales bacterium]